MMSRAGGAVVGAAVAVALAAGGIGAATARPFAFEGGRTAPFVQAGPGLRTSVDLMFATHMIPHHESAIAMAEMAVERSQRDEVRGLSEDIIATQTAEISELRDAADRLADTGRPGTSGERWGGEPGSLGMRGCGMGGGGTDGGHMRGSGMEGGGMGGSTVDLETLKGLPAEQLDQAYLEAMIEHHRMGVRMAEMEVRRGSDADVVALAQDMVRVQTQEIGLMESWLQEWYGS